MASTLQQLLQRQRGGRVQTGDLPDARVLQAAIRSGGQYNVQVQQAGKSKLTELAEGLSKINPALRDFSVGTAIRDEGLMKEGYVAYQEDPKKAEEQLAIFNARRNQTKQGIRSLIKRGVLPDEANAVRMLGALKAKASAMVLDDYRANVMAGINETTDVEAFLEDQRKNFLTKPTLDSQIVKEHALGEMTKVENEFRNIVQNRQLKREIEQGKQNWLRTGEDLFEHAIAGTVSLSAPEFKEFINHEAGLFAGSKGYVFNNLIKKKLLEGLLTTGPNGQSVYSPSQVKLFLGELRRWKISDTGAKFADAEVGNAISAFGYQVDSISDTVENKNLKAVNLNKDKIIGAAFDLFHDEYRKTGAGSLSTYNETVDEVMKKLPPQHRSAAGTSLLSYFKSQNGMLKDGDTFSAVRHGELVDEINEGKDLWWTAIQVKKALQSGKIRASEYDTLIKRINDSRDFSDNVLTSEGYKQTDDNYQEIITGFTLKGRDAKYNPEASWFHNMFVEVPDDVDARKKLLGTKADRIGAEAKLADVIRGKNRLGAAGEKLFMNQAGVTYQRMFKENLRARFAVLEGEDDTSPQEAAAAIKSELHQIASDTFKEWESQIINKIKKDYNVNFTLRNSN